MNKSVNTRLIYNNLVEQGKLKDIDYKTFFTTIQEFNKEVMKEVIYKNNPFITGSIGSFKVLRQARKGNSINWNASKKLKQQLIDSGRVPYNKVTAPDGEKWFIYYEGDIQKMVWDKPRNSNYVTNFSYCVFTCTRGNNVAIGKFIKSKPDNIIYELRSQNNKC